MAVLTSDQSRRHDRHLVPSTAFKLPAKLLLIKTAPLLKEERNILGQTLIPQTDHPLRIHRSGPGARLTTDDRPVNARKINFPYFT